MGALALKPGSRPDWFRLPREVWEAHLRGVPGVRTDAKAPAFVEIHRTHLPLLPGYEIQDVNDRDGDAAFVATLPPGLVPRPLQLADRTFIRSRRGTLLAHEMRKGKTLSAIFSHELPEGQLVICAPLAARQVWLDAVELRWPGVLINALEGLTFDPAALRCAPIIFLHYQLLDAWRSFGVFKAATVVFDEGHGLGNRKTKRTKAAFALAAEARARVIVLTGTPLWNKPASLYPLLQLVAPAAFGRSWFDFGKRYCGGTTTEFGFVATGASHQDELKARVPEVMRAETWGVKDIRRRVEIVALGVSALAELDKKAIVEGDLGTTVGAWAQFRRLLGLYKVPRVVNLARDYLQRKQPVVIWCWHKDVASEICDHFIDSFLITSDTPVGARERCLALWRTSTEPLILTLGVGQVAIDLSHATANIFAEVDWTPAVVAQAEMRAFKDGRTLESIFVCTDHPLDLRVAHALAEKVKTGEAIGVPAAEGAVDFLAGALGIADEGEDLVAALQLLFDDQEAWVGDDA